jgi:transposase
MALHGPVDQSALQKRRLKAVRLFEKGITPSEVARRLGVHRQSAGRWRTEWLAGGDQALKSKGRIGRKSALSAEQTDQLATILKARHATALDGSRVKSEADSLVIEAEVVKAPDGVYVGKVSSHSSRRGDPLHAPPP